MIWTPMNDVLDYRNSLQQNFTNAQIDLAVSFLQVPGLKPDTVSLWSGRDRELSMLGLEAYLAHTVVLNVAGQHKTNDILCVNASSRGYFKDVFSFARGLRSSLFVESAWESQALDLISVVCSIAMSAASQMLWQLRQELPQAYVADDQYDFQMLPEPFDVLIHTLQACVVVMPTSNPCDGSAFLYQWLLRHYLGPTEADIFASVLGGGTLIDALRENGLLANSKLARPAWVSIVQQHYIEDMQYQPWHRGDKEGILAHSVNVLMQMFESQEVEYRCIPGAAFDAYRRQHKNDPIHVVMCSASGKLMLGKVLPHHKAPPTGLIACPILEPAQASVVAQRVSEGVSEALAAVQAVHAAEDILVRQLVVPLPVIHCQTGLAVASNLHQAAFEHLCQSRQQALWSVTETMPAWGQSSHTDFAKDVSCHCQAMHTNRFPCDDAWHDMQVAITIITAALQVVRKPSILTKQVLSILLVGPGGAGKTHVMKEGLRRALSRCSDNHCVQCGSGFCCGSCRLNCEASAMSSLRAAALNSKNLYKLFGFRCNCHRRKCQENPTVLLQQGLEYFKAHPECVQYLRHLEVLFIDEVAFVPNAVLHACHLMLQHVKQNTFMFGNVLLICTADHYQNEPVSDVSVLQDLFALQFFMPLHLHHLVRCQCNLLETVMTKMRTPDMSDNDIDTVVGLLQQAPLKTLSELPPTVPVIIARRDNMQAIMRTRMLYCKGRVWKAKAQDFVSHGVQAARQTHLQRHHELLTKATRTPHESYFSVGGIITVRYNLKADAGLLNGATLQVTAIDVTNKVLQCMQLCPKAPIGCEFVQLGMQELQQTAFDGSKVLRRYHIPAVMAFVDTCHAVQGTDQEHGIGFYIDNSFNSAWARSILYTLLSRARHLSKLYLLSYVQNSLRAILMQRLPVMAQIDDWVYSHDGIRTNCTSRPRFRRLYQPIPQAQYPAHQHLAYCVANCRGDTYIGYTEDCVRRIQSHNLPGSSRPYLMDFVPAGWLLMAWVGPFDSQADAEEFERKWQNRGKKNGMRSMGLHIAAALSILADSSARIHYNAAI